MALLTDDDINLRDIQNWSRAFGDMQRYVLRQQSNDAPTSDEVGAMLAAVMGVHILDQGSRHLFVAGGDPAPILAKAHVWGWSVSPEQHYALPEHAPGVGLVRGPRSG